MPPDIKLLDAPEESYLVPNTSLQAVPPSSDLASHAGVAGAVLLPVAGLGIGVTQVVRGAVNTPEAIREVNKGRLWDQVSTHSPH